MNTPDQCSYTVESTDVSCRGDEEPPSSASSRSLSTLNPIRTLETAVELRPVYPGEGVQFATATPLVPESPRLRSRARRTVAAEKVVDPSTVFRKKFYPEAKLSDWNDWRWQARHRIRTLEQFERMISNREGPCSR
jgi:hypothetical protein